MDDVVREHLDVHQLVLVVREALLHGRAIHLAEELVGLSRLAGHPVADDGVHLCLRPWCRHGVIGAAAVDADPLDLLGLAPLGELAVRVGMLDHVADLVGRVRGWSQPK